MVIIPKKNEEVRLCINRTCPKDCLPIIDIDQLVEATSECGLLTLIDGYSGCNRISLGEKNQEHNAFSTPRSLNGYPNEAIADMPRTKLEEHGTSRCEQLRSVLRAYKTTQREGTRMSPSLLLMARKR